MRRPANRQPRVVPQHRVHPGYARETRRHTHFHRVSGAEPRIVVFIHGQALQPPVRAPGMHNQPVRTHQAGMVNLETTTLLCTTGSVVSNRPFT